MVFKAGDIVVLTGDLWDGTDIPEKGEAYVIDKICMGAGKFTSSSDEDWYAYEKEDDPWAAVRVVNEDGSFSWNADDVDIVLASLNKLVERGQSTREQFDKTAEMIQNALGKGVKMARLPRDRKGKTPIDVGIVTQDGLTRVRVSMGEDGTPGRKNSDLSYKETEDLITMLSYNLALAKGEIETS